MNEALLEYQITRLTFEVSVSLFTANINVKQNAHLHEHLFPSATSVVHNSLYIDDRLTGANSIPDVARLQKELQVLFARGGFLLRK